MALPFLTGNGTRKPAHMVSVDLGARTTKAALLQKRGEGWALASFALLDAPIFEKKISPEMLTEHLKAVVQALETPVRNVTLSLGLDDAILRAVEMPQIPTDDMRQVLKTNSKGFLQQDLSGHVCDCHVFSTKPAVNGKQTPLSKFAGTSPKLKVLVGAAKQQMMEDFDAAIRAAGLVSHHIVPGFIGMVNSFELAEPDDFNNGVVALMDIGFKHTSICVLDAGNIALMRTVNIGGDQITTGLAETLSISYAEAEGIKLGMAPEVASSLEAQVQQLGREIRASLDFFEHQEDRPVSKLYVSGGSALSEIILQTLYSETIVMPRLFNPTSSLEVALPGHRTGELEHIGPQLAVAIGAALSAIN